MVTPFVVAEENDGAGVVRLVIAGEVDEETGTSLTGLIVDVVARDEVTEVVVDLQRVTILSAAGVRALLTGQDAAAERDRRLRVVTASGVVYQVLKLSNVHRRLVVGHESDVTAE